MYAASGEPNVKWWAPISNWGAGHHCPPAGDGPAVGLDFFQLHVHSVNPCLCMLPIEPSLEGLQLGTLSLCSRRIDIRNFDKNPLICYVSHFTLGGLEALIRGSTPTKVPHGDGTGYQQASI